MDNENGERSICFGNKSRRDLGTLPLDDIKESLIALATNEQEMSCLLNLELNNRKLEGLKFADIYLTAMKEAVGDFARSVEESCKILNMRTCVTSNS